MAERVIIKAAPRTVLGKKVATLRRNGRLPANVYGRGIPSQAVDIDAREFSRTIKSAGLRAMIQLSVDGEASPRYVILRGMERKGGTGEPIHIDFFQVDPEQPSRRTCRSASRANRPPFATWPACFSRASMSSLCGASHSTSRTRFPSISRA